jgi:enoyl-[acyl-carrier protein] reductase I
MALLEGKTALVAGVANKRSIAWAIAQALGNAGARLAFTYEERVEEYVRELASAYPDALILPFDARSDESLAALFAAVGEAFGGLDIMIHSIAYALREELNGRFVDTSRAGFQLALDVSVYSLVAMARRAAPLMEARGGGSMLTMTFQGGERVLPNYNVMGVAKAALEATVRYLAFDLGEKNIRVNAISAGPVRTLSGRAIAGFPKMEELIIERSPLHRGIDASDAGQLALFLCSPGARNITGDIVYVDSGYHIMGL